MDIDNVKKKRGRPRKETASDKETALSKETAPVKETVRRRPKPKNKETKLPTLYRNNAFQTAGLSEEELAPANNFNTRMIRKNLKIMNLPEIDIHDYQQVQDRINEYFGIEAEAGFKPTVAGLANSLGIDRFRLFEIRDGKDAHGKMPYGLGLDVANLIKSAYKIMEQNWEDYMQQGQINPVSGIFLGKNNYRYQDKTEYVLTPNQQTASDLSEKQLLERYGIDSEPEA